MKEFTTSLVAGRDVLAEADKSLALVEASQDAIRSSCDQVVSQHEPSVKAFAEELKAFPRSNIGEAPRQGALCRPCSARLAHFCNYEVSCCAGEDPFVQVKALVTDLINKLQAGASSHASQQPYRDEESKATQKKEDHEAVAQHSSKLEGAVARSTLPDGEISALQSEQGAMLKRQLQ